MVRVLHVLSSLSKSAGVAGVIMNYYRHIDREQVKFDFLCFKKVDKSYEDEVKSLGGKVFYLNMPRLGKVGEWEKSIERFFAQNPTTWDVIHNHEISFSKHLFRAAKKSTDAIRIVHSHLTAFSESRFKSIRNRIFCSGYTKYIDYYFACSTEAGKVFGGKKFRVLNNAVDLDKFAFDSTSRAEIRGKYGVQDDEILIGNLGRICKQKNQKFLISVLALIPKAKLFVAGAGTPDELIKQAEKFGVKDRFIYAGVVNEPQKYLSAFDVFALPSIYEGLPIVGVEAQASGLKCVMTASLSKDAFATASAVGLKLDSKAWANELAKLSPRANNSVSLREKGFDITKEADKLAEFYLSIAKERK